jgi:hypothetical protein
MLLRRLFFINEHRTKFVSADFYPAREYLNLVEFAVVRRGGGPKTVILSDEQVDARADDLPKLHYAMLSGGEPTCGTESNSGAF